MQEEEKRKRKYVVKLMILVVLLVLTFWASKSFFDGSMNSKTMLVAVSFLKAYFYFYIFVILFEISHYFITRLKLKIKSNVFKFLISTIILIGILLSNNFLLFFCGPILIISFLYLRSVFNIKKLYIFLLIIFPITFLVSFFYYSNYHLEYFYKGKNMKMSVERIIVPDKVSPVKRNVVCSKHAPLDCEFIRSSDIEAFGGLCLSEDCSSGFMIECVYMCPK